MAIVKHRLRTTRGARSPQIGPMVCRSLVGLAVFLTLLALPTAALANFTWGTPTAIDQNGGPGQELYGVACPSTTQCTAVDEWGQAITFNPSAPGSPKPVTLDSWGDGANGGFQGISCPSTAQCTAVGGGPDGGDAVTFNPASPKDASSMALHVDGAVSCPSISQCTTVSQAGGQEETFDPQSSSSSAPVTLNSDLQFVDVSCPAVSQCTAVDDQEGDEITFDPASPGAPTPASVDPGSGLYGVACPSVTQCTAVDYSGDEVTFNPASPSGASQDAVGGTVLHDVACPSVSECVATGDFGEEVAFDPASPGNATVTTIGSGSDDDQLEAVDCPAVGQCTTVDYDGQAWTFNPSSSSPASPTTIDPVQQMAAVSCPSASQCTAVDLAGQAVTFAPDSPNSPKPADVDPGQFLKAISCPTISQCSAVDAYGGEVTFDPVSPGSPTRVTIDSGNEIIDSGGVLQGISCPTVTQCTAVGGDSDGNGSETTFNPQAPGSPSPIVLDKDNVYHAVSCPTPTQCTAVDEQGAEGTFNPRDPTTPPLEVLDSNSAPNDGLFGVACPSVSECVAAGSDGDETTFNPTSPGTPTPVEIDGSSPLASIACASTTECVATDPVGDIIVGDPTSSSAWSMTTIPFANGFAGIACPSTAQCTAVDQTGQETTGLSSSPSASAPENTEPPSLSGSAVVGQTLTESHGTWSNAPDGYTYQWERCDNSGFGCSAIAGATSQTYVLTTADLGHTVSVRETASNASGAGTAAQSEASAIVASSAPPSKPLDSVVPKISGTRQVGHRLRTSTGTWSGSSPISYDYQWERCKDACLPIGGATTSSYTLRTSDARANIVVVVTATNSAGSTKAMSGEVGPVSPAGPTSSQVKAALAKSLVLSGPAATITQLLKHDGLLITFAAPSAGHLVISWYAAAKTARSHASQQALVASLSAHVSSSRKIQAKIRLTGEGRKLLRHATRVTLVERGSFTPTGGSTIRLMASAVARR